MVERTSVAKEVSETIQPCRSSMAICSSMDVGCFSSVIWITLYKKMSPLGHIVERCGESCYLLVYRKFCINQGEIKISSTPVEDD